MSAYVLGPCGHEVELDLENPGRYWCSECGFAGYNWELDYAAQRIRFDNEKSPGEPRL